MKTIPLIGAALVLATSAALAQTATTDTKSSTTMQPPAAQAPAAVQPSAGNQPPASEGPGNKAVNTDKANNPNAPIAGANSFTEGQAKSRIERHGFKDVGVLKKDDRGVWRGEATGKDGKRVQVGLDYQGNIVAH